MSWILITDTEPNTVLTGNTNTDSLSNEDKSRITDAIENRSEVAIVEDIGSDYIEVVSFLEETFSITEFTHKKTNVQGEITINVDSKSDQQLGDSREETEKVWEKEIDGVNIFEDFSDMDPDEKRYLHHKYTDKSSGPQFFSASNTLLEKAPSAGFATAVVSYGLLESVALALSLIVMSLSSFVYIFQKRTEISEEDFPDLYNIATQISEDFEFVESPIKMYVISIPFLRSPFTLPIGGTDVYIPKSVFSDITLDEYRAIIEHEVGHHKNNFTGGILVFTSFLTATLLAPVLVVLTPIEPGLLLFGVLFSVLVAIQIGSTIYMKREEETADSVVTNPESLSRFLVRASPIVVHTDSQVGSFIHQFADPHPPMNKRIEDVFDNSATVNYREDALTKMTVLGLLSVFIGSLLSGYGFLTFVDGSNVGQFPLFYGIVFFTGGVFLSQYQNIDSTIGRVVLFIVLLGGFGLNILIGNFFGAESLVESVAVGRLGREIMITIGISVVFTIYFLSTLVRDSKVDITELEEPATDWKDVAEEWEDNYNY